MDHHLRIFPCRQQKNILALMVMNRAQYYTTTNFFSSNISTMVPGHECIVTNDDVEDSSTVTSAAATTSGTNETVNGNLGRIVGHRVVHFDTTSKKKKKKKKVSETITIQTQKQHASGLYGVISEKVNDLGCHFVVDNEALEVGSGSSSSSYYDFDRSTVRMYKRICNYRREQQQRKIDDVENQSSGIPIQPSIPSKSKTSGSTTTSSPTKPEVEEEEATKKVYREFLNQNISKQPPLFPTLVHQQQEFDLALSVPSMDVHNHYRSVSLSSSSSSSSNMISDEIGEGRGRGNRVRAVLHRDAVDDDYEHELVFEMEL